MKHRLVRVRATFVLLAILSLSGAVVYGQGSTTSTISGVVVDSDGGVVPGAEVVAKHTATAATHSATTNSEGAFAFAGLSIGTYTVTVTLQGFKTVVVNDVVLTSGAGANVKATLEVGGLTEQVVVSSSSEIIQTQSSTISNTINASQITKLPLTSRSAMDFVNFMPGVSTPGGNRDATINGLPQGSINITLDGVNIQDNTLKTGDGFFAIVSPRLDAIEEVTVTTAAQGADGAGQGAVQIKFVTRSGTNNFTGSGYYYYRSDKLNANTWFNNRDGVAKAKLDQKQIGARFGGPIVVPGLFDGRNKAFFFVNYEELRQPSDTTRNRTILNTAAQLGNFTYATASGNQTRNVLEIAAANGQLATADPIMVKLLSDIRAASTSTGSIAVFDPNLDRLTYNLSVTSLRRFPTARVDYNLTDDHRFTSAFNYNYFTDSPDTLNNRDAQFPGFPVEAGQSSKRLGFSNSLRSTLRQNLVNEARVGYSGAPVSFFSEMNVGMYTGSLANQGGFHLVLGSANNPVFTIGSALTNAGGAPANPQSRNATTWLIEDTVTWLRGSHSLSLGTAFTQNDLWLKNSALVPTINFGVVNGDPAQSLFSGALAAQLFPGASATNLTAAQNLYAILTGRVSGIDGDARLNESTGQYDYMGTGLQRARMREAGFFAQDSWRITPTLTANLGLRYELQFPFYPTNSSYSTATLADLCGVSGVNASGGCNLFQPGVRGKSPEFINFGKGSYAYDVDWNNLAPSLGFAWAPKVESGLLKAILGPDNDGVIRAGYARSFNRNGMSDFSDRFGANPGVTIQNSDRSANLGNLNNDGLGFPVLLRATSRLSPAAFPTTPSYPTTDIITENISIFDQHIQVPWAESYTAGLQRSVTRSMAIEIRYVGTRSRDLWRNVNYNNDINVFENGFVNEFRQAQANLQANIAAGRGGTFRYFGAGTGTGPLPVIFGYFQGAGNANDPAAYTSTNFSTNNAFLTPLAKFNPNAYAFANALYTNNAAFRTNAAAAGIPVNLFLLNPDLQGGANITTNEDRTSYNSLQLELRRRLSGGLQFQTSYVFGKAMESDFRTLRRPTLMRRDTGVEGDLTHAFKANVVYDFPFGQGRRFAGNANGVLERIVGGWQASVTARVQSGRLVDFGQRPAGRHDVRRRVEDVQAAFRRRGQVDLQPASGRHRRDHQGVQRQRDDGDRLRRERRAERSVLRAGERSRLHRGR